MTTRNPVPLTEVSLLILAGGKGSRMGGKDKGLMEVAGKPAIEHLLDRFAAYPGPLLINANRNLGRYADYGYPVIEDTLDNYRGPLAGMLAGLRLAPGSHVLTLPVDAPLVSQQYPARMASALAESGRRAYVASLHQRMEPVFCLLEKALAPALQDYLEHGQRAANRWLDEINAARVDFSDIPQQFINLNAEQDQNQLKKYLK